MANEQALATLRDIHLPQALSWWPLAPGWYFLILILVILLSVVILRIHQRYTYRQAIREALSELADYQQEYETDKDSQLSSAKLSALLKRVALAYYPRTEVAGLTGDAWIAFLNATGKTIQFNEVRNKLLDLPYQPHHPCDLDNLFTVARQWILRQGKPCLK